MIAMFLTDTEKWWEVLSVSDYDFYQTPEFLQLESKYLKQQEAVYFYYEQEDLKAVIPLLKREIMGLGNKAHFDLISPYGYPGILTNRDFDYRQFNKLSKSFLQASAEEGFVSAFIRLNPLQNNFLFNESDQIQQVIHGNTIYVDLSLGKDTIEKNYSSNHRRNNKKLKKMGFIAQLDQWDYYTEWQVLYIETMKRLYANEYYRYPEWYFDDFRKAFEGKVHLITVHDPEGILCAGGLFTTFNGIIQYHLGGTKETFLKLAPTKLMFDQVIDWGIEEKMNLLHLGGGLGGSKDTLFHFKQGFSKEMLSFSSLRYIARPEDYMNLSHLNFKDRSEDMDTQSFFPLYRHTQ